MAPSTKQKLRGWLYFLAGLAIGVAEAVQGSGDIYSMTLQELGFRALRALPFVALGHLARRNLFETPVEKKDG